MVVVTIHPSNNLIVHHLANHQTIVVARPRRPRPPTAMSASSTYILAINCGSSSIKAKLFDASTLGLVATLTVKNIAARGEKVRFAVRWEDEELGSHVDEQGEDGDKVECELW
jgi:hypothetical protein